MKENEALQQRIKELETENFHWRQQADQLRDLPLEDVAWHLGLTQDTKGSGRWKGNGHIINIDSPKWYDFAPGVDRGGGGAIDLVMHVYDYNFKEAVAWLRDSVGESGMLKAVTHHARSEALAIETPCPQFTPPASDESQWSAVEHYLTSKRGLPKSLVQNLHNAGLVYSDRHQNAVFCMRNFDGETTGAFKRGTRGEDNT